MPKAPDAIARDLPREAASISKRPATETLSSDRLHACTCTSTLLATATAEVLLPSAESRLLAITKCRPSAVMASPLPWEIWLPKICTESSDTAKMPCPVVQQAPGLLTVPKLFSAEQSVEADQDRRHCRCAAAAWPGSLRA